MGNLIDIRQVVTQILGFLILLWGMRKFAWGPVMKVLEERRAKIAGEFAAADRARAEANESKARYESELRGIEARARARIQEAIAEGEKVAGEIRQQAQGDAAARLERAQDEIAREREKAKESVKEQIIHLSMRTAEKILRQKLDDAAQRRLVGEFVEEVGAEK
ncbi:MAG TPA: F0F1 ATP synthase subunit B [Candidatus Sulfotelmatobacter sp.]|nr:F0F1 ATP synthase subunit B [Candidatus Sulfotelmatobacter sp.]